MPLKVFILLLVFSANAYAWNDEETHPTISEFVTKRFFGADFMADFVNGSQVKELIRAGSKLEDTGNVWQFLSGTARSLNHFHNPARETLSEAGLTDIPWFMSPGMPTPLWAQDGNYQNDKPQGNWSWQKVREHEYKYLTALSKDGEDEYLSKMLKGLGYQMHLIQDMGQPNHVRNDTHIWDGASFVMGLETWARSNNPRVKEEILNGSDIPPVTVDLTPEFRDDTGVVKVPVARLFDTRGYKGARQPSADFNQGLAEYTNSNFFSESTVFAAEGFEGESPLKHYNPYPKKSETNVQDYIDKRLSSYVITDDGDVGPFETIVISKKNTTGEKLDCLATTGPLTNKLLIERGEDKYFYRSFMYESCFPEYAAKLIPASAAYSSAMLDYFFRGELTVTVPQDTPPTSRRIRLNVRNSTKTGEAIEAMDGGSIELMVIFRPYKKNGTASAGTLEPDTDYQFRKYTHGGCTRENPVCTIHTTDTPLDFDLSTDPIPVLARDISLVLVYRGKLGKEQDAVAFEQTYLDGIGGDLDLSLPARGVYASVEGDAIASTFGDFAVSAQSRGTAPTPAGNTELMVIYRAADDPSLSLPADSSPDFRYASVTAPTPLGISNAGKTELQYTLAGASVPVTATDVYVYAIHTDTNGVVTHGYSDISEPTPVDVFNNADKICINGQWQDAGSTEAKASADSNSDGIPDLFDPYAHNIANVFAKASSIGSSTPASTIDFTFSSPGALTDGSFRRLGYILTDYSFSYSLLEEWMNASADDPWSIVEGVDRYAGTAVKNQADSDGNYVRPGMYIMRGHPMWWGASVIYDNDTYPAGSSADDACGWENLPE